ncbi:hypothetical protein CRE_08483 [Caenorhabditis remanei]|uniref:histone acetyltransferase n=1 Tax=Caenorhabditis remanei TaxID=31234 RepID=E3N6U3_CAERE|nr:hypothetical protein CRE_08483 [Caenorhabditis remanei]
MLSLANPSALSPETKKLVQQQLVFLIHANACMKKSTTGTATGQTPIGPPCNLPHCQNFKHILGHMKTCRAGPLCSAQYCNSSRVILKHWTSCTNESCAICSTIRHRQT